MLVTAMPSCLITLRGHSNYRTILVHDLSGAYSSGNIAYNSSGLAVRTLMTRLTAENFTNLMRNFRCSLGLTTAVVSCLGRGGIWRTFTSWMKVLIHVALRFCSLRLLRCV